ncbi:MAG: ABC transporter ATP-binding protein [Agarilytica sp.]
MSEQALCIKTNNLSMQFGGQIAVNQVSCSFVSNSVNAIIGPNGAGKSTLLNLMSGQLFPTWGEVYFNNTDITAKSPAIRTRLGIGRAFQKTNLFPNLTAHENIRLAVQMRTGIGRNFWSSSSKFKEISEKAEDYLKQVSLDYKRDSIAGTLSHGQQRRLEIGVLMALEPKVYILDEPTNGMSLEEVPEILDLITKIHADEEKIVILVEHKMDFVKKVADRVIVMHNGNLIGDGTFEQVMNAPQVQGAYLGVVPDAGVRFVE